MKIRTTLLLMIAVLLLGAFIWFHERKTQSTSEQEEQARRALQVKADRVSYLKFESTNLLVECALQDGQWMIIQPVRARADEGEIGRILNGLETLPRGEVITPAQLKARKLTEANYGFDAPRARITLGDSLRRQTLIIGRDALLGGSLYIREESRPDIVATGTNVLQFVPGAVADLRDRVLFHGEPQQVRRLEIRRGDGFVQVGRSEDGRWTIQQPLVARAAPTAVDEILRDLFDLRVEEFVADGQQNPVAYGLDEPTLRVNVLQSEKEGETALLVGDPLEKRPDLVYVKLKGVDSVYAMTTGGLARLTAKVEDLRDRRLVTMSSYDIAYVRIAEGETELILRKDDDGWWVSKPKRWPADAQRVDELLRGWAGASIVSYLDDQATNLAALGLAPPARRVEFRLAAPDAAPNPNIIALVREVVVLISDMKREMGRALVKVEKEDAPYEILADTLKTLSLDPLYYRDRRVLKVGADEILRIALKKADGEQIVEPVAGGAWRLVQPDGKADAEAIKDLLMIVGDLRAVRFVADDPQDLATYGLDEPVAVLSLGLKGEGSGLGKTLLLGSVRGKDERFAMLQGQDVVFTISEETWNKLTDDLYVAKQPQEAPSELSQDPKAGP